MSYPHLITCRAPGLDRLRVVPAAEERPVLVEVDEVDEELPADGADKAPRVPQGGGAGAGGRHADVPAGEGATALEWEKRTDFQGKKYNSWHWTFVSTKRH